jgi:hypothetical protein
VKQFFVSPPPSPTLQTREKKVENNVKSLKCITINKSSKNFFENKSSSSTNRINVSKKEEALVGWRVPSELMFHDR